LLCLTCPLHFLPVFPGIMGTKTLTLEPEEAVLSVRGGCYDANTRRPYGELGSVDAINCLCCVGVGSNLTKNMPLCPGWCGRRDDVDEIVRELKRRMKERGDTAQINRAEEALNEIKILREEMGEMRQDMKRIMEHLGVNSGVDHRAAPGMAAMER